MIAMFLAPTLQVLLSFGVSSTIEAFVLAAPCCNQRLARPRSLRLHQTFMAEQQEKLDRIVAQINHWNNVEAHLSETTSKDSWVAANQAVKDAGYRPLGTRWDQSQPPSTTMNPKAWHGLVQQERKLWRRLDHETMVQVLAYHIGHDLAYHYSCTPKEICRALAQKLLLYAEPESSWWTNLHPDDPLGGPDYSNGLAWDPISEWTFDAAFVGIGKSHTLLVCFFAED